MDVILAIGPHNFGTGREAGAKDFPTPDFLRIEKDRRNIWLEFRWKKIQNIVFILEQRVLCGYGDKVGLACLAEFFNPNPGTMKTDKAEIIRKRTVSSREAANQLRFE